VSVTISTNRDAIPHAKWILGLGFLSAVVYLAAQSYQYVLFTNGALTSASALDALHGRLTLHGRTLSIGILISFFLLPNYYLAIAACLGRRRPAATVTGLFFSLMFVFIEIVQRSIDYFMITDQWAASPAGTAGAVAETLAARAQLWGEITIAVYVPLLVAHFLGSLYFLPATRALDHPWRLILSGALILNCLRLAARLTEYGCHASWLHSLNQSLHYPLSVLVYGSFAVWLLAVRQLSSASFLAQLA
jgi:hypothetical protein